MSEIKELLQASDGLTEDFKAAAPGIFEEAVKKAVKMKKEEEGDDDAEENKHEVCPECGKDPCVCENDDDEEDDEVIPEKCDKALKEAARRIVEMDKALKEAAERIVVAENKLEESKAEYAENLSTLQENIESLVEARVAERTQEIEENLDVYMDYVSKELMEQYKEPIIDCKAVEMASQFMESLGTVYAKYNIESPSATKAQDARISELESQLAESNKRISEVLKDARELAEQVCDYKRIEIVNEATAGMTDLDRARFFKICSALTEERNIEVFTHRVDELLEGFKSGGVASAEASASTAPVITEGLVQQPKNPQVVYDPIKALAASMERMY